MEKDIHPKMYMYRRIVEAKLFIDANYAKKIDLRNISEEACFSKYHFLRLFKKAYARSPHDYLTEVRIGHAKKLLKDQHSAADACLLVGFDSIPSFTRLFKQRVGITPKAFADQYQSQQEEEKSSPFSFVPNCFAESFNWKQNKK